MIVSTILFALFLLNGWQVGESAVQFPEDFVFGAATAAYQIEGAWNISGKGPSIWDQFTHDHPERIVGRANGDMAMDSYHLYKKDVAALNYLGAKAYRFSLSWTRLLPDGFINKTSAEGLRYYNTLIDALLANGIEPVITIYHWDTPEPLQRIGGFANREIIPYYIDYVEYVFRHFGDRVKKWITFNEINMICPAGYKTGNFAPGLNLTGHGEYLCAHNMLLAHASAYRLYHNMPQSAGGIIGIVQQLFGYYPLSQSQRDIETANLAQEFVIGWVMNPVFSQNGDYPQVMKDTIRKNSLAEGYKRSRLPEFTPEEVTFIRGTADFLGINHYSSFVYFPEARNVTNYASPLDLSLFTVADFPLRPYRLQEWPRGDYELNSIVPEGFRDGLLYIKRNYGNPRIMITECGFPYQADGPNLNDYLRVDFTNKYLTALLQAINAGVDVFGYMQWALIDTLEWNAGYSMQFGLFHVNHSSTDKLRHGRLSSRVYRNIIKKRNVDFGYFPVINNDAVVF